MTTERFIYGLSTCDCLLKDGKIFYEREKLIKHFDDLGLLVNTDKESPICSKCHIIATSDFCERCGGK